MNYIFVLVVHFQKVSPDADCGTLIHGASILGMSLLAFHMDPNICVSLVEQIVLFDHFEKIH